MLDRARETGLVRIELDTRGEIDLDLSVRLRSAHGLRHCVVIDAPEDDEVLLRTALGRAAAELLAEIVEPGDVLGLAWARSLMAMRTSLTRLPACDVVQLTGALSLPSDDSSIELVRDLARKSNGQGFFYYAPMVLPDAATAKMLRTQPDIARAIERYPDVTKAVIGVGAWQQGLSTVVGALTEQERREIYDLGVRGELSGVQIDGEGNPVTTPLTDRLIGIDAAAAARRARRHRGRLRHRQGRRRPARAYAAGSSRASSPTPGWRAGCCSGRERRGRCSTAGSPTPGG